EPLAARFLADTHRYFPEWADRPESSDRLLEADHNSYLAGGYSEEFGYRVRADFAPRLPLLLEDPERSEQWRVQCGGLHPGYPECPRPVDREGTAAWTPARGALDQEPAAQARQASQPATSGARARAGDAEVVSVDREGAGRSFALLASLHSLRMRWRIRRELHRVHRVM
ncbi:MAG: hypothetical protein ACREU3_15730, partial [Steroidobacteraceae bacterium]